MSLKINIILYLQDDEDESMEFLTAPHARGRHSDSGIIDFGASSDNSSSAGSTSLFSSNLSNKKNK